MTRRDDLIDSACQEWASAVRHMEHPTLAKEYVGALRCTLAARRDLHHGSRSGKIDQQWPEYPFQGTAGLVNVVYRKLPPCLQEIMVAHYVALTPRSKSLRADLMGLSVRLYWERVGRAKSAVSGALAVVESVRTVSASW
jgi:hypothetical protein